MAQEQAPSVGAVMDGYRFKGGDPKQESSWEQVEPIDVSAQYGAGARQLPNGVIERVGPKGGVSRIGSADGSSGGSQASALVGADARARFMINLGPLQAAQANLERMDASGYDPSSLRNTGASALEAIPFDGGFAARAAGGDDYNAYTQAAKTFEAAIMPIMSGAAVTPSEAQRLIRAALPQPGDSPEVLAQKSEQRRMMINAVAQGIGEAAPYDVTPIVGPPDETGLPTYPRIDEALAAGTFAAPGAGGPGAALPPSSPSSPGGPDAPVDISGLSADDLLKLQPGQFIRFPDGRVEQLSGAPRVGAEGEEVSPGVFQSREPQLDGASDDELRRAAGYVAQSGVLNLPGANTPFLRGAVEQAPLLDEALDGVAALATGESYGDIRRVRQAFSGYDRENNGLERNMGGLAGATATMATPFGAPLRATRGATLAGRVVNRAAGGSVAGGLYGFGVGEGNALDRAGNALVGAGVGGVAGVAAPPVVNALARPIIEGVQSGARAIARPIVNALGDSAPVALRERVAVDPLRSGIDRFAARSPQNVNALTGEASRFRAEEIAPAFADVVSDGGRGTMRALATRQTPARQSAREFADGRAAGLQDRLSTQARRTISDDPRQPAQIREEITTRRNTAADRDFGAVRGDRISPDREIMEALRTPAMRPAIEEAATSAANRGDMDTARMLRSLAGEAMDYGADAQITVGMADRIARSLNGRAEAFQRAGNNDAAASHFAIAERLRGGARQQVPGYDQALNAYAADSGLAQATELGEQFMSMEADQFAAAVARLSPEERQIARAAARRAVERQGGTQGQAPGVAQRLSNGREQASRTAALTGDAAPVQRAMGAELQTLRNAQGISPAQGSPTGMNAQDALGAAGAVRDAATGNVLGLASRAMNAIRSRGFSDREAEAVVEAAIDPARTDELISMLAQRMSRREAHNLTRVLRHQLTTGPQSGQQ